MTGKWLKTATYNFFDMKEKLNKIRTLSVDLIIFQRGDTIDADESANSFVVVKREFRLVFIHDVPTTRRIKVAR